MEQLVRSCGRGRGRGYCSPNIWRFRPGGCPLLCPSVTLESVFVNGTETVAPCSLLTCCPRSGSSGRSVRWWCNTRSRPHRCSTTGRRWSGCLWGEGTSKMADPQNSTDFTGTSYRPQDLTSAVRTPQTTQTMSLLEKKFLHLPQAWRVLYWLIIFRRGWHAMLQEPLGKSYLNIYQNMKKHLMPMPQTRASLSIKQ